MSAALRLPVPEWTPLSGEQLARELVGAANGARSEGEVSACGRWLVALYSATHPLHYDRHELYRREGDGWGVMSAHLTRDRARAEVGRQRSIALGRNRDLCLRCWGSGWLGGDDCPRCAGSGTREAQG